MFQYSHHCSQWKPRVTELLPKSVFHLWVVWRQVWTWPVMSHILGRCDDFTMNNYVVLSERRFFKFVRSTCWINGSVSRTRNGLKLLHSRRRCIAGATSRGGLRLDFWVWVNLNSFFFNRLTLRSVVWFVLLSLDWCLSRPCLFDLLCLSWSSALFSRIIKRIILRYVFSSFVLILFLFFFIKL